MIVLPAAMLISICIARLEALVPIAPALAPVLQSLRDDPPPTDDEGDEASERMYIRIERLQAALATVEVKLHAAAKAADRARVDALSALIITAFTQLDVMAAGAVMERIAKA